MCRHLFPTRPKEQTKRYDYYSIYEVAIPSISHYFPTDASRLATRLLDARAFVNANVKLLKKCIYAQVYLSCPEPVFGAITHPVPTTYAYLTTISLSAILELSASPRGIHIHQGLSLSLAAERDLPFPEEGATRVRRLTEMLEEVHAITEARGTHRAFQFI